MIRKKILVIFGTRPEAIKMAPVIMELKKNDGVFNVKTCVTGQHREMLDQVLKIFSIKPDYDLNVMKPNQKLTGLIAEIITNLEHVLSGFKPDLVLVHGDTTSALGGAIAAFYNFIPVGHIEAGLRTWERYSPWPEEINRQLIDKISTYLFAPTNEAKNNLLKENISESNIEITGNTVIDSICYIRNKIYSDTQTKGRIIKLTVENGFNILINNKLNRKIILVTSHRRENHGESFLSICNAIKELSFKYSDFDFVYPVHLNPNIRNPAKELLTGIKNIFLLNPIDYESFVYLMDNAYLILTDSGGIQEEAPALGKPVLVMREITERPEAINSGSVKLVGTDRSNIVKEVTNLIENSKEYERMITNKNPYGDGNAAKKIVEYINLKMM